MPGPGTLRAQHKSQREYRVGGRNGQRTEGTLSRGKGSEEGRGIKV